jgi:hypothetical protein
MARWRSLVTSANNSHLNDLEAFRLLSGRPQKCLVILSPPARAVGQPGGSGSSARIVAIVVALVEKLSWMPIIQGESILDLKGSTFPLPALVPGSLGQTHRAVNARRKGQIEISCTPRIRKREAVVALG